MKGLPSTLPCDPPELFQNGPGQGDAGQVRDRTPPSLNEQRCLSRINPAGIVLPEITACPNSRRIALSLFRRLVDREVVPLQGGTVQRLYYQGGFADLAGTTRR